jgi:hypothetical protein
VGFSLRTLLYLVKYIPRHSGGQASRLSDLSAEDTELMEIFAVLDMDVDLVRADDKDCFKEKLLRTGAIETRYGRSIPGSPKF